MKEILETIAALPPETIDTLIAISTSGFMIYMGMLAITSLVELIYELAMDKSWRRNSFIKYLDNEDIELIDRYIQSHFNDRCIGEVIINAYQKKTKLKALRKQKRKEIFNKLCFWRKGK